MLYVVSCDEPGVQIVIEAESQADLYQKLIKVGKSLSDESAVYHVHFVHGSDR